MFEFPTHEEFPPGQTLAVHLPGEQIVYFNPQLTEAEVRVRMEEARSTLMAFFLITMPTMLMGENGVRGVVTQVRIRAVVVVVTL